MASAAASSLPESSKSAKNNNSNTMYSLSDDSKHEPNTANNSSSTFEQLDPTYYEPKTTYSGRGTVSKTINDEYLEPIAINYDYSEVCETSAAHVQIDVLASNSSWRALPQIITDTQQTKPSCSVNKVLCVSLLLADTELPNLSPPDDTRRPLLSCSAVTQRSTSPLPTDTQRPASPLPTDTQRPALPLPTDTQRPALPLPIDTQRPALPLSDVTQRPALPPPNITQRPTVPPSTGTQQPALPLADVTKRPANMQRPDSHLPACTQQIDIPRHADSDQQFELDDSRQESGAASNDGSANWYRGRRYSAVATHYV
jgi:hypothetical protein